MVKIHLPMQERQESQVWSLGRRMPWSRKWQLTPVFLLGEFHGEKNLEGYSPWGCKELDTAEHPCIHTAERYSKGVLNGHLNSSVTFLKLKLFVSFWL